jgi:hypothetical protein
MNGKFRVESFEISAHFPFVQVDEGMILLANSSELLVVDMLVQKLVFSSVVKDPVSMVFFNRMCPWIVIMSLTRS